MRDPEIIETELMEISAIADDTLKFERIIAGAHRIPTKSPSPCISSWAAMTSARRKTSTGMNPDEPSHIPKYPPIHLRSSLISEDGQKVCAGAIVHTEQE